MAEKKEPKKFGRKLRTMMVWAVVIIALATLTAAFFVSLLQMSGTSMEPTLKNKDVLFMVKAKEPARGDIVSVQLENKLLVKRVVGIPGDVIDVDEDENLLVNGEPVGEALGVSLVYRGKGEITYPLTVPKKQYFILCDNTENLVDSRVKAVGCVEGRQISGRVVGCIWPFNHIRIF